MKRTLTAATVALLLLATGSPVADAEPHRVDVGCSLDDMAEAAPKC